MYTYLLTVDALDELDNPVTLRFSTSPYMDAEKNYWNPVIKVAGLYRAGLYAGKLLPSQRSGYGETTLMNLTGELDYLVDYAVDGRTTNLYRVMDDEQPVRIIQATTLKLVFEPNQISVVLRDPVEVLDENHPRTYYAGDNVLPDGLEGTEDDIKGQPKPRVFGSISNATPLLVNTSKLIYQISDNACTITDVWDNGAVLTEGAPYADLTELQSVAPSAGEWRKFEGFVRLGATPTGAVTLDATTATSAGTTIQSLIAETSETFCPNCVSDLNNTGTIGFLLTDESTTMSLLDSISEGLGCYWRITGLGVVEMAPVTPPSTVEDWVLPDYLTNSITRSQAGSGDNGLPIHKVTLEADKVETVQTDLVGSATAERRARVAEEYRLVSSNSTSVKTRHPLSSDWEIKSHLRTLPQAQSIANTLLSLVSVRRDSVDVEVNLTELENLQILDTVKLVSRKLGYKYGRNMLIIGYTVDSERNVATINLWG